MLVRAAHEKGLTSRKAHCANGARVAPSPPSHSTELKEIQFLLFHPWSSVSFYCCVCVSLWKVKAVSSSKLYLVVEDATKTRLRHMCILTKFFTFMKKGLNNHSKYFVAYRYESSLTFLVVNKISLLSEDWFENNFTDFREAISLKKIFEIVQGNTRKYSKMIYF